MAHNGNLCNINAVRGSSIQAIFCFLSAKKSLIQQSNFRIPKVIGISTELFLKHLKVGEKNSCSYKYSVYIGNPLSAAFVQSSRTFNIVRYNIIHDPYTIFFLSQNTT